MNQDLAEQIQGGEEDSEEYSEEDEEEASES